METLDLGLHRRVRVWLDEPPISPVTSATAIEQVAPFEVRTASIQRRVTVEIFVPHGGRSEYGLLGAMFTPKQTGQYTVRVTIAEILGPQIDWALAFKVDEVHTGLPAEYAGVILAEASLAPVAKALGSGVLVFDTAAHGLVGSSSRVFQRLARIVLRLLMDAHDAPVDANVMRSLLEDTSN